MKFHENKPNYDKKNKVIKQIFENGCTCYVKKNKDIQGKYYEWTKKSGNLIAQ